MVTIKTKLPSLTGDEQTDINILWNALYSLIAELRAQGVNIPTE